MVAGGHVWLPGGMRGCQGRAWLPGVGGVRGCHRGMGACMVAGGVCGCRGACMVAGGCAWLQRGVHGCGWGP